ncbi:acyl carrier protein [Campylobacter mucosalis]|uniref:Formyltransferase domain-containing protein n=1 Tax=Campylobacter mucosalis CCUG 21559 TaxID=1032067 RepID=A0A6G5QFZ1_9BACT|nr:acyl carrier protein [Campylobacter mucosalis]QCD44605.1 formyltransferase domain-containing protein [Campylobacter mucosalis CCUG 21559]
MNEVKEIFVSIGRDDINESMGSLLSCGVIDSMDIMALVSAIENRYKKSLDAQFITRDSFESFEAIKDMIDRAFGS